MEELKLTKAPGIKVILESGEYVMRKPTVGESRLMQKQLQEDKSASIDIMVEMLEKLGMPKEVSESLDTDAMEALSEALIAPKKK